MHIVGTVCEGFADLLPSKPCADIRSTREQAWVNEPAAVKISGIVMYVTHVVSKDIYASVRSVHGKKDWQGTFLALSSRRVLKV